MSKYPKIEAVVMYVYMYCIPSKLESTDCSSYSPWSNYWHDLELPLSSDFSSVSTMDQPQLHDGSMTAPARITAMTSAAQVTYSRERPSTKSPRWGTSCENQGSNRCDTWQSLKYIYIEKLRLHGVNMAPPTWHQPGSNVVLMYKYVAVDRSWAPNICRIF